MMSGQQDSNEMEKKGKKESHLQSSRRKTNALQHKLNDVLDSLGLGFGGWVGCPAFGNKPR